MFFAASREGGNRLTGDNNQRIVVDRCFERITGTVPTAFAQVFFVDDSAELIPRLRSHLHVL